MISFSATFFPLFFVLSVTSSPKAIDGFVTPFAMSKASRAIASVSQPFAFSDISNDPGIEASTDDDSGVEASTDETGSGSFDAEEDVPVKKPSFKPTRHTLFVGNVPFGMQ